MLRKTPSPFEDAVHGPSVQPDNTGVHDNFYTTHDL